MSAPSMSDDDLPIIDPYPVKPVNPGRPCSACESPKQQVMNSAGKIYYFCSWCDRTDHMACACHFPSGRTQEKS